MGRARSWGPALVALAACAGEPDGTPVAVPGGGGGIGFDDLRFARSLRAIVAPAGRAGVLAIVDPDTTEVAVVGGFSADGAYDGGHDFGATSVDEGRGVLFVTDRTARTVSVVDAGKRAIVGSAPLAASPDYVRYVAATDELWITEPSAAQIEIFALSKDAPPVATSTGTIPIANGPESLVVDQRAGRAYVHRWQETTVVLDVRTRAIAAEWANGCAASRGLAIDEARGLFIAGCLEGTVTVLDAKDGRPLSSLARGAGYDVLGYAPEIGHLYAAGTACKCLVVLGVANDGQLSFLGRFDAPGDAHCAAADDRRHAWVCDPGGGRLLRVDDPFPGSF